MAHENESSGPPSWLWPLATGLAVGFMAGYLFGQARGHGGSAAETAAVEKPSDAVPAGTKMPAKIYSSESEFPEGWTK